MWIMSEDRQALVNLDHVERIEIAGREIRAGHADGGAVTLYRLPDGEPSRTLEPMLTAVSLWLGGRTVPQLVERVSTVEVGDVSYQTPEVSVLKPPEDRAEGEGERGENASTD